MISSRVSNRFRGRFGPGRTGGSPIWTPAELGANLKLHINGRTQTGKTKSDVFGSTLDSFISNDPSAHSFTHANANNRSFQGGGEQSAIYTRVANNVAYINAERGFYRFLHDDSSSEFFYRGYIVEWPQAVGNFIRFFENNGGTSAQVGMSAFLENSATNPLAVRHNITDGSGVVVINSTTPNVVPATGYLTVRITKVPTSGGNVTATIYINGTQVAQVTSTNPVDAPEDPTSDLSVLRIPSTIKVRTQDIIAIDRALTTEELVNMNEYLERPIETYEDAYVGAAGGQSNLVGGAPNPSVELQAEMDFFICSGGTAPTAGTIDGKLLFGSNNQGSTSSTFGPELAFGYDFAQAHPNKGFMMKYAAGGTSMYGQWRVGAVNSLGVDLVDSFVNVCKEIKYRLNRNPIVLYYLHSQGETDAHEDNPNGASGSAFVKSEYKTEWQALCKKFIDDLNTAGFDTSGCRIIVVIRGLGFPPYEWETEINEALTEVAEDILTLEPSLVGKCLPGAVVNMIGQPTYDGTHFNNVGQEYKGHAAFDEVVFP